MPTITIPYKPRSAVVAFHNRTQRNVCWIAHRRFGKTVGIGNDGLKRLTEIPIIGRQHAPPKIAWMYPTRVRAKDIAWSYLKYYSRGIPGIKHVESELALEFPDGRRFTLYGADGHRGVGQYLDGIYYDERDDIPDNVIVDLAPTLTDYHGFEVHAGMLRGRQRLWKLRQKTLRDPDWLNIMVKASESGVIPDSELALLRTAMGQSAFDLQMECNPNAAMAHAIYGHQMEQLRAENRLCRLSWDPAVPVDWFADIGHSLRGDEWSWWGIQLTGRDILLQCYLSNTNVTPAWYVQELRSRTEAAGCTFGCVYLPHDGSRMDRHGNTAQDDLKAAGVTRVKIVPRTPNRWESINDVRDTFTRFFIDESRCDVPMVIGTLPDGTSWVLPSGLDCLDLYSKKENQDGVPGEEPEHNQYSHGADALRTFIEALKRGMIDGTSMTVRGVNQAKMKVLRGPSSDSYSIKPRRGVQVIR